MKRREFIALVGCAATAPTLAPLDAVAQQVGLSVIGVLNGQFADAYSHLMAAFHQGLHDAGFSEGRNVSIEYRWAEGRDERVPALAAELVDRQIAVLIVTGGSIWSSISAKAATTTIPIVGAHQHAAVLGNQRKDMARPHEIAGAAIVVGECAHGIGAHVCEMPVVSP